MIFSDIHKLALEIRSRFEPRAIIGVDGWTLAGKTYLAKALAEIVGGSVFDLDSALVQDQNCFVAALRMDDIRRKLAEAESLLFVPGICNRQVFALAEQEADAYIYVKRIALSGWADEDDLLGNIPEFSGSSGESIRKEMRTYHANWRPHLTADYEFHRLDN